MNRDMPPQVSVVIPTFNRGWVVGEAVESVLSQTYDLYELIVVDDGSDDETADVLAGFGERLTMIRQQNRGVSAARNAGAAASTGRLLAFLDSDDLWLPEKLAVQVDFMERRPEARVCQTEEIWIRNGSRVNPKRRHRKPSGLIFEESLTLCLVSPSAVMIRRNLFERYGGFDESLPACEDYDLWLRIGCRWPVYRIDRPLVVKRGGHADQLSRQPGLDRYRVRSLLRLVESGRLTPTQRRAAAAVLAEKAAVYATGCRKRGRVDEAIYYEELVRRFGGLEDGSQDRETASSKQ
ncbi:MAG: glycosyltransferase [Desulfobacteraceae bacterium]|nr:glycosyltransferase [Desulfobacteraceae bacterium]